VELGGLGVRGVWAVSGRWDDPNGHWRAKYVGASAVGCYLEVLAAFRPDPELQRDIDAIESDGEDDDTRRWRRERWIAGGVTSDCFVQRG
jgi:hypothetical protein